jgi:hypothetical protein
MPTAPCEWRPGLRGGELGLPAKEHQERAGSDWTGAELTCHLVVFGSEAGKTNTCNLMSYTVSFFL